MPLQEETGVRRVESVDVLDRIDRADDSVVVDLLGKGKLDEDPRDASSAFSSATSARISSSELVAESSWWNYSIPASAHASRFRRT